MSATLEETLKALGLADSQRVALIQGVEVPRYGSTDLNIPALRGKDLSKVAVLASNGQAQTISETSAPERFNIKFTGLSPNTKTDLHIYYPGDSTAALPAPVESPPPVPAEVPVREKNGVGAKLKKKIIDPLTSRLQNKQKTRVDLKKSEIRRIREKDPSFPGLNNKRVLTFDHTGSWPRALGMIQKAIQLREQAGVSLHKFYHRMSGQGDGAIIAAAFAAGISPNDLGRWWVDEWRKVHTPNRIQQSKRWLASKFKANETGFDSKKARKALQKLFTDPTSGALMIMGDARTELYISVIQADFNMSLHRSDQHQTLPLWSACEDTAVTKMDYNQKVTIQGEAVFLGAVEKNDVLGMVVSPDNEGLEITSIGTPVRVYPDGGRKFHNLDAEADKVALRASNHFVYDKRVEQVIKKLKQAGCQIRYLRLDCEPIDAIVANSTTKRAMTAGVDSGGAFIDLPEWFKVGLPQIT